VPYTSAATDLTLTEDGRIVLVNGNIWAFGRGNITVELEHGFTDWGKDLQYAALRRLQHLLFRPVAAIPDQAATGVGFGGATFTVAGPDVNSTGIAEVDAVYARYPKQSKNGNMPASRPMDWDPQYLAVFRGSRS
jgi:hypothetical protein